LVGNLLKNLAEGDDGESVELLLQQSGIRLERIVSHGERSPDGFWYDQPEDEWVLVLRGFGEIAFADGRHAILKPGDHLLIPAHCRHRVEKTALDEATIWLALFLPRANNNSSDQAEDVAHDAQRD